jgi:hypothetical protein
MTNLAFALFHCFRWLADLLTDGSLLFPTLTRLPLAWAFQPVEAPDFWKVSVSLVRVRGAGWVWGKVI